MNLCTGLVTLTLIAPAAHAAVEWDAFLIRDSNGNGSGTIPTFAEDVDGNGITATVAAGEKVGYGTSYFNGQNVGDVPGVTWTVDAAPNFGLPNEKSPYLNLWITRAGQYALIAPFSGPTTNVSGLDWDSLHVFIFERSFAPGDLDWIETGAKRNGQQLVHADNSPFTIAQLAALGVVLDDPNPGTPFGGSGAPKNGTAFNLIFGDSAANYVGSYDIDNILVPEPASVALLALGGVALLRRHRSV